MEDIKFEWCFEIDQKVTADVDGAEDDNLFKVTAREVDDDNQQWFTIERLSDGEVWEDVPASLMDEAKE